MLKIPSENFICKDTLQCGQVFRFEQFCDCYKVFSAGEMAILKQKQDCVEISSTNDKYFENYFDLNRNYVEICESLRKDKFLFEAVEFGKGIRILKQDIFETIISFLISQNNNIARIKKIIQKLCENLGEKKTFEGQEYFAFPTAKVLAEQKIEFFESMGAGYRAKYIQSVANSLLDSRELQKLSTLSDDELKISLQKLYGVGEKVCDCIMLFAFSRTRAFPVDTWMQKVYVDSGGTLTDRKQISKYYSQKYGELSGFAQQYLFYHKRETSKNKF